MTNFTKRATVYFDPVLHKALRLKSAETSRSISELINDAIKLTLAEDADDLAAFEERANEPLIAFEDVDSMVTSLQIDDSLINEVVKIGKHKTKKEAITQALKNYLHQMEQIKILNLFGKIDYDGDYDYKAQRKRN